MALSKKQNMLEWIFVIIVCVIFIQSLFFKFSGSQQTQIIFGTVADWMATIPAFAWATGFFRSIGGYAIGVAELIASFMLLFPKTRVKGALLGLAVISGAIFFHLFTPLGISIETPVEGQRDGGVLFSLACLVFISCIAILWLRYQARRV